MKREVFNYPPSVEVLKILTAGSLKQNLAKAVRLWVILRSIYGDDGDEVKLELGEEFTFLQWRDLFLINNNIFLMRLRAWGPNVEVILPWDLRQRMKTEMEATYSMYKLIDSGEISVGRRILIDGPQSVPMVSR